MTALQGDQNLHCIYVTGWEEKHFCYNFETNQWDETLQKQYLRNTKKYNQ